MESMTDVDPPDLPPPRERLSAEVLGQYSWGLVLVFALATGCWGLLPYTGQYFSAVVFLMAIVLVGTRWRRGPVIAMAAVSALAWNFIFIPPRFTLHIDNPQDVVMFILFFVVALSIGHLTSRLHAREEELEIHHHEREQLLEAKHKAEILAESERLHRTLLDSVSHELKTPLAVIRTALDGLDRANPYVGELATATRRLQRVVENFLEMTRVDADGVRPRPDWTEFSDVVQAAVGPLEQELSKHQLSLKGIAGLPLLMVDGRLVAQALGLIVHNATVHAPPGTEIELEAEVRDSQLVVRVRDRGPGLPPWACDRVFEKFYRAPGAAAGGTGLGLAIARGLIKSMGGHIDASNHPDGGAQFRFSVPVRTRHTTSE